MSQREETLERLRQQAAEEDAEQQELVGDGEDEGVAKQKKKSSTREYVVVTGWKEVARIEATSPKHALEKLGKTDGEYGIAPVRNWSTKKVGARTETVVEISDL